VIVRTAEGMSSLAHEGSEDPAVYLLDLIAASWTTQVVAVAAELELADHLQGGRRDNEELAALAACHAPSLLRLLRALVSLDLCAEPEECVFEARPAMALLAAGSHRSLRGQALWWGRYQWPVWEHLGESVRTGMSARSVLGDGIGVGHAHHDWRAVEVFDEAMAEFSRLLAPALISTYDFRSANRIVDVGGGHAELLVAICRAYPSLRGVVLDLPHAMPAARAHIASSGLTSRCHFLSGDFFQSVPAGFDLVLLKSILHCWPDEPCRTILLNCRQAMGKSAKLLLVERLLPASRSGRASDRDAVRMDLNMLVGPGGRERTRTEMSELLAAAGFALVRCISLPLGFHVMECLPTR
jgi:orsellinic acid C2-O-methyltransferase